MASPASSTGRGKFNPNERSQLRELFHLVDSDGNGAIDTKEVQALLEMLGMTSTAQEAEAIVREVDVDSNGTIEFDELENSISGSQTVDVSRTDILRAFRMFEDKDAPVGCIRPQTLASALRTHCSGNKRVHDEAYLQELISCLDANEEGYIDFRSLVEQMCS